jgi:hypothetical protein
MTSVWLRVFRAIVRFVRGEAIDLRTAHAEATFTAIAEAAARRGRLALTVTAIRELTVVAGLIALAYLRLSLPRRRPHLPELADSLQGLRIGVRSLLRSHPSPPWLRECAGVRRRPNRVRVDSGGGPWGCRLMIAPVMTMRAPFNMPARPRCCPT